MKGGRPLPWILLSAALILTIACVVVGWRVKAVATETAASAASSANVRALTSLLDRYDQTAQHGRSILQRRDDDPSLTTNPSWQADSLQVVAALKIEYDEALILPSSVSNPDIQTCISEGLRLSYVGYQMLDDGFRAGGHHAYFLGSHGNWDFNLGTQRLQTCRGQLQATG